MRILARLSCCHISTENHNLALVDSTANKTPDWKVAIFIIFAFALVVVPMAFFAREDAINEKMRSFQSLPPETLQRVQVAYRDPNINRRIFVSIVSDACKVHTNGASAVEQKIAWWGIRHPYEAQRVQKAFSDGLATNAIAMLGIETAPLPGPPVQAMALKLSLCCADFLIAFGLSSFFLRDIFPWKKENQNFSNFLAFGTAFFLSVVFALWLFTAPAADELMAKLTAGFTGVVSKVLTVLFAAIAAYFFWKKVKGYFKKLGIGKKE